MFEGSAGAVGEADGVAVFKVKLGVVWSEVPSVLLATTRVGCVKNENSELTLCVA
jgi:hypothetical protein